MLVGFGTAELSNNVSKCIILGGTKVRDVGGNNVVDGEDVCHFDVQCRFGLGVEVVELVNVELCLGIGDGNDCFCQCLKVSLFSKGYTYYFPISQPAAE